MKKNCVLSIFLILMSGSTLSAQNSKGEITGFWEQTTTWTGGTIPGSISGGTITATGKTIVVDGTVKTHNNLTVTGFSSLTINSGDTLIVFGNLTVSGVSGLTNNGVLMVTGNLTNTLSSVNNTSSGKLVIMGNYANGVGVLNAFTGPSYVYGSDTGFLFAPGTSSQATMATNDPSLNTFVNWMYGVLPVELVSFVGQSENGYARFSWITSSEFNNDHFILERSPSKDNFEVIGTVTGAHSSKKTNSYATVDNEPLAGTSYYRLSQVDTDGNQTYLQIISVVNEGAIGIEVYPNPTTQYLFISGTQANDAVYINDATGVHQSISLTISEVIPGKTGIDVSTLETGVYSLHVTRASKSFRFVKR